MPLLKTELKTPPFLLVGLWAMHSGEVVVPWLSDPGAPSSGVAILGQLQFDGKLFLRVAKKQLIS